MFRKLAGVLIAATAMLALSAGTATAASSRDAGAAPLACPANEVCIEHGGNTYIFGECRIYPLRLAGIGTIINNQPGSVTRAYNTGGTQVWAANGPFVISLDLTPIGFFRPC